MMSRALRFRAERVGACVEVLDSRIARGDVDVAKVVCWEREEERG